MHHVNRPRYTSHPSTPARAAGRNFREHLLALADRCVLRGFFIIPGSYTRTSGYHALRILLTFVRRRRRRGRGLLAPHPGAGGAFFCSSGVGVRRPALSIAGGAPFASPVEQPARLSPRLLAEVHESWGRRGVVLPRRRRNLAAQLQRPEK